MRFNRLGIRLVSEVIRLIELQVWFVAEHVVDVIDDGRMNPLVC